jgi:hypothetical protein
VVKHFCFLPSFPNVSIGNDGVGGTFDNDTADLPFAVIPERLCRESKLIAERLNDNNCLLKKGINCRFALLCFALLCDLSFSSLCVPLHASPVGMKKTARFVLKVDSR